MKKSTLRKSAESADNSPPIRCACGKVMQPDALRLNPRNPNKHGPEQLRLYAKILVHQGWRKSIVVSRQSGLVVTGAGAVLTAQANGWQVPVDVQDFKTPADEWAHLLADNQLPQMSEMDQAAIEEILRDELDGKLDRELAGLAVPAVKPTELKPVEIHTPPKMAWVLVGIPLVRFGEINAAVEKMAKVEGIILETTASDMGGEVQQEQTESTEKKQAAGRRVRI